MGSAMASARRLQRRSRARRACSRRWPSSTSVATASPVKAWLLWRLRCLEARFHTSRLLTSVTTTSTALALRRWPRQAGRASEPWRRYTSNHRAAGPQPASRRWLELWRTAPSQHCGSSGRPDTGSTLVQLAWPPRVRRGASHGVSGVCEAQTVVALARSSRLSTRRVDSF
ncbi:hypothetical protein EMIHUDRAFT_447149 [Emiliania huxleyi CCMP1516]|uniref:Uncharacterized protein n=2 Tax=Emiliania huxleyi TaxID=2903 RepID=A0A0D3K2A0_EMIH1|nr:hypothetical protein EMIHUDRAFT_447149 [Emiliania huxleyi CCMP1516]EOD29885.1 hypothetical protein EMIHUDRAFT_447149 [Emiliania huxleyi CCMP1516]|eukprot:XP_005782314.1 hypothetical protein EMIHUDRAFT_447149 [Emiliania huxleyi CCMP1516]